VFGSGAAGTVAETDEIRTTSNELCFTVGSPGQFTFYLQGMKIGENKYENG